MPPYRVILGLTFAVIVGCSDVVNQQYATYEEARQQGIFDRGWLPDILPQSSVKIFISNDLDLNTSQGTFQIDMRDYDQFVAHLLLSDETNQYHYTNGKSQWVFIIHSDGKVTYQLQQL